MAKSSYQGKDITIHFDGEKCIHARYCVLGQPNVFRANVAGPWIQPDNASVEELVVVAKQCPSGAITYDRHDGGREETPPDVNTIRVLENGPLAVRANLQLGDNKNCPRATLCRCGASKKKPYCDGSHSDIMFSATGEPAAEESEPLADRGGILAMNPLPNGPLEVNGNVELIAGTGHTINRVDSTYLCRCGHSANKPYCDGSHNRVGFSTE